MTVQDLKGAAEKVTDLGERVFELAPPVKAYFRNQTIPIQVDLVDERHGLARNHDTERWLDVKDLSFTLKAR